MTNLISCRRSSSTSLIHLFTATDCSSSPAGVAAANNVIVAAFNKLCDLVAPSLSLPIENACSLSRTSKSDLPKCSTASSVRDSSRNGKKLLTMEKKGSRRWMSGGSNRSLFPMLWLVPHQMIFLSGVSLFYNVNSLQSFFFLFVWALILKTQIMCWRELKESLLQVDITMERSNFFQIIHSNYLESGDASCCCTIILLVFISVMWFIVILPKHMLLVIYSMITHNGRFITEKNIYYSLCDFCPERWNPMCWVSRETFKKMS
ncbi:uncharacterized protein LOC107639413 isoform X1 [Arachis ipaensis]|uniref:uncharacterized protein LOC107639413 isoform X1 n=2 Tax=Arachis ipaensis TaxID=130454 RepID=UPI0007AFD5CE|nr:uncharacterized protein LOC107639413 isoform X1 [Arachis ipaensis]